MKLWLVRHARPLIEPGVCYGATDVAADSSATLEAAACLASLLPVQAPVLCSPSQRCVQLARNLQELRPGLRWQADARLTEMNFGCWEGWRWCDIPHKEFIPWIARFHDYRFGGCESTGEVMERVAQALSDSQPQQELIWITHAGVIRAASLLTQGVSRVDEVRKWPRETVPFGTAYCVHC